MLDVIRADICNTIQKPGIIMACHDCDSGGGSGRGIFLDLLDLLDDDYAPRSTFKSTSLKLSIDDKQKRP